MAESNNLKKFAETVQDRDPRKSKKKIEHPKGFNPSVSYSQQTKSGEIVSEPQKENKIDWKEQLESYFGADAKNYRVLEDTAEIRFWDMAGNPPQRLYYFKAKIVSNKAYMPDDDFRKLLNQAKKKKPTPSKKPTKNSKTFCIALSDWQIGKEGTEATIERWMEAIPKIKEQIKTLRKSETIDQLFIAGLGDIVEGCTGFYAQQEFTVELDYRQQQKVARRMAYTALKELVPMFDKTVVSFIAGNHGEPRNSGKSFTTFSDNRDIMLGEELAEIFKEAPAYKDKIDFIMPDSLSITLDISDTVVTLVHGHQMRGGGNPQAKARTWLANQSLARSEIADSDLLLMGHYHFFSAYESDGKRLILQAPSLDSGSEWFDNTNGGRNSAGVLTLIIGGSEKWSNIRVIR
jgi:predicted phosphodiesterase